MRWSLGGLLVSAAVLFLLVANASSDRYIDGMSVGEFSMHDYRGRVHHLSEYESKPVIVLAFVSTGCPLAELYAQRLEKLSKEYAEKGVQFLGISSNRHEALSDMAAYASRHDITFPILKDNAMRLANELRVLRTPEVFVLDRRRTVQYRGRIDNQYEVGLRRPQATSEELRDAIDAVLNGRAVTVRQTKPVGCLLGRATTRQPRGDVTYREHIAPILDNRCVRCHRAGEIGPFPLTEYAEVEGWADMIREVVRERRMPPWHADPAHGKFKNDPRLSREEIRLISTWVENGAPEGEGPLAFTPRVWTEGWQIPEPEHVFPIHKEPFEVPAEGAVEYQFFRVDPGFTEDKWVQAIEARPGNRAVVHHIEVSFAPPGQKGFQYSERTFIGYVPGGVPFEFPKGTALRIPAGGTFDFRIHYTPIGTPQKDFSYCGVIYAEPEEVERELTFAHVLDLDLRIPAGARDHRVVKDNYVGEDSRLLALFPHLHLRGKSFRFDAYYPDGRHEVLLNVPRWDFNWQPFYLPADPPFLPAGTRISIEGVWDNSADNPSNPDPTIDVYWGEQTWDEMFFGQYITVPERKRSQTETADNRGA